MAETLVEKTQHQIEEMILNKEYDSNNYLPSEGELCKKFSVSRVTVRDAVRALETRGFLKRIHGKGLMVLDNSVNVLSQSITYMINLRDCNTDSLLEVRNIIEEACASLAAQRATEEDLRIMEQAYRSMENSVVMDEKYFMSDLQFHIQLVNAAKNPLLCAMVDAYTPLLRDHIERASQLDYCIEARHHFHRNIYEAIKTGDAEGATAAMRRHLQATGENQMNS